MRVQTDRGEDVGDHGMALVVDDDEDMRGYFAAVLPTRGYRVVGAGNGEEALARLAGAPPAVIFLDVVMPGMDGLEVLERIQRGSPGVPVVVVSAVARSRTVVDALRRGAIDYLTKPWTDAEFNHALDGIAEARRLRDGRHPPGREGPGDMDAVLSASPRMQRVLEIARHVADTDVPVLLLGESGVGKEILARHLHALSARRSRPFVKVNCAALPHDLLESELFGFERGAFSGAIRDKPGWFELADRGTLLLDEIGEMSPPLQAKLLHVLQDGEFVRLGARRPTRVDVRILASTNVRLQEAVRAGRFREDLYYRLDVVSLTIPPLRERLEDVPLLASHFLRLYGERYKSPRREVPPDVLRTFLQHPWPGNVRELENAIRRFAILPEAETLLVTAGTPDPIPPPVEPAPAETAVAMAPPRSGPPAAAPPSLKAVAARAAQDAERELAFQVLSDTRWNRREAARRLKVSYKVLLNRLKQWKAAPQPARAV